MELTNQNSLLELVAAQRPAARKSVGAQRRQPKPADLVVHQPPIRVKTRCRCGTCATCLDNARWDRIFTEKFADPSYYHGPVITQQSSLRPY